MNSKTVLFQALAISLYILSCLTADLVDPKKATSIFDFTVQDTYGNDVPLSKFKGNVVIIVNIASICAFTIPQYRSLMNLRAKYHDEGLRILAFPSNQFAEMPEPNGDILMQFLKLHNVEFDLVMKKGYVNGPYTAPLYQYLKSKQGGFLTSTIEWNFVKFLVDKNGQPVQRFLPIATSSTISKHIEKLLA